MHIPVGPPLKRLPNDSTQCRIVNFTAVLPRKTRPEEVLQTFFPMAFPTARILAVIQLVLSQDPSEAIKHWTDDFHFFQQYDRKHTIKQHFKAVSWAEIPCFPGAPIRTHLIAMTRVAISPQPFKLRLLGHFRKSVSGSFPMQEPFEVPSDSFKGWVIWDDLIFAMSKVLAVQAVRVGLSDLLVLGCVY